MRVVFLILLLVNALAFIAIRHVEHQSDAASQIALLQIHPEKVNIIALPSDVPNADKSGARAKTPAVSTAASAVTPASPPAVSAAPACYDWGEFAPADVARVSALLSDLGLKERATPRDAGDSLYWVYIPGLKTKAEADTKAAEVKKMKAGDFSVMVDGEAWMVSLGAFKTEDNADQRLAQVKKLGVRSAIVDQRGPHNVIFTIRDPNDAAVVQLAAFKTTDGASLPLKSVACQ